MPSLNPVVLFSDLFLFVLLSMLHETVDMLLLSMLPITNSFDKL